jgi:hypothetical protein
MNYKLKVLITGFMLLASNRVFSTPECGQVFNQVSLGKSTAYRLSSTYQSAHEAYGGFSGRVFFGAAGVALFLYQRGYEFEFSVYYKDDGVQWFPSAELGRIRTERSLRGTALENLDIAGLKLGNGFLRFWFKLLEVVALELRGADVYTCKTASCVPPSDRAKAVEAFIATRAKQEGVLLAYLEGSNYEPGLLHLKYTKQSMLMESGFTESEAQAITNLFFREEYKTLGHFSDPHFVLALDRRSVIPGEPMDPDLDAAIRLLVQNEFISGRVAPTVPLPTIP